MTHPTQHPDTGTGTATAGPARDRRHTAALVVGALAVLAAGTVATAQIVGGARGRLAGTTSADGSLFSSGRVDVALGSAADPAPARLLVDAANLTPDVTVERCLSVTYRGTVAEAEVRLFGRGDGGTGLDRYLATTIEVGTGTDPRCGDFAPSGVVFDGSLADLSQRHGSYAAGVPLMAAADAGDTVTIRFAARVADDDEAQGRDAVFWLVLEARP